MSFDFAFMVDCPEKMNASIDTGYPITPGRESDVCGEVLHHGRDRDTAQAMFHVTAIS